MEEPEEFNITLNVSLPVTNRVTNVVVNINYQPQLQLEQAQAAAHCTEQYVPAEIERLPINTMQIIDELPFNMLQVTDTSNTLKPVTRIDAAFEEKLSLERWYPVNNNILISEVKFFGVKAAEYWLRFRNENIIVTVQLPYGKNLFITEDGWINLDPWNHDVYEISHEQPVRNRVTKNTAKDRSQSKIKDGAEYVPSIRLEVSKQISGEKRAGSAVPLQNSRRKFTCGTQILVRKKSTISTVT